MLRALEIRDLLIIDHLELDFQPGLNVLTGETGAGKSILLDSLGFVLGWRGRAELVRAGAEQGEVIAEFELPEDHPAHAILEEAGLPGGQELILRRINRKDGRKTAWINDRRCSGEVLRTLSETLVELHGQHDDRGLLDPKGHRDLLDQFGGLDGLVTETRQTWSALSKARRTLRAAEDALKAVQDEEEFLRHAVSELDALDPQPGEEGELDSRRRLMQAAEKVKEDVSRAHVALGYEGAEGAMGDALRWLEGAGGEVGDELDEPLAALGRAMSELGDAVSGVERCMDALDFNPIELEQTEERLFAIRGLARKHNVVPDELGNFAEDLRGKMAALDAGEGEIASLKQAVADADAAYSKKATALSAARKKAATRLDKAVMTELAPLKMERAVFTTQIEADTAGPDGTDAVSFTVATNPGAPSGPLAKIASGGELSRFLLALKVCLTSEDRNTTMIFDEIDRGVGGATADAVGRRLSSLAQGGQILVVTHSPQVAALGAHHWRVEKRVQDEVTLSTVTSLGTDARVDEIARMISGDKITEQARSAAEALLAG
ncbi:DNA repair protein RecN [Cognatishimia activa]|uniref:DNA repair protein RecN n=1 Tax=Cognatishimia activa TaxID=1715691 RepID=A0A0P1IPC9_9RHOB|nr:DNA repair protein RecN [Cognatishimia activa]CUJ20369.1 Recombination protein N [Cognatishimia activa]CUK25502.1 Recombination protein N [Cognatishimia activa]